MITDSVSLPHPVLGISDDIIGHIAINVSVKKNDNSKIAFHISTLHIENNYFNSLLDENKISVRLKIYCSSTYKTWVHKIYGNTIIEIDEHDICNKVEIEPYIVADLNIDDYTDASFNADYQEKKFEVRKYEIVGVLGKLIIPIDKDYEQLGIDSLFEFAALQDSSEPCSFELNQDKILIKYPITIDGEHPPNGLFHQSPWAAYNIFIIPALTEAFKLMGDPDKKTDIEGYRWFDILEMIFPSDEREEDAFKNAQLLLDKKIPLLNAYHEICKS